MNNKKLRYAILKEIRDKNFPLTEEKLGIDADIFDENIRFLGREHYILNVYYTDNRPKVQKLVTLTEKGENYLEENSAVAKTYKGLKELRDWIKI